ncbi:hypothetical protein PsYK624_080890 [Phanerochaete sordida]|uniref:Uncharacterized protein n=1 Tax=Phanerochaete sordida TaxID=48140 RepID=A0A9P3GC65_9APHY|nr:hypothetical protein PsYK624_080890 [Phanerochaete sordida]
MSRPHPAFPEDILREILSYVLLVSPQDFFRHRPHSTDPLREARDRNGQLLLVSKSWLRAGTPLLYASLELSRPKHTSAVAKLFREHPDVGAAVRSLRLEGGLTKHLVHVATHTPNLRGLYIDLYFQYREPSIGLVHALPLFAPTDLYVDVRAPSRLYITKRSIEVKQLLFSHVASTWVSLRTVTFGPDWFWAMTSDIETALINSSIEEFRCSTIDLWRLIIEGTMKTILESGRVSRITYFGDAGAPRVLRNLLQEEGLSEHFHKFTFSADP